MQVCPSVTFACTSRFRTRRSFSSAGETRNATFALPSEFPVGAGELTITGTGGVTFEEKRDVIVYDNRHVILVQTSASTYRPKDIMEIRVVATNEELMPVENGELNIEIYDAALKLVGVFPRVAIRSGLTETLRFPIGEQNNFGTWLVSAIIGNSTSSLEILVARPVTPSFDLKAIFQRFVLRTEKTLRGVIEIDSDDNEAIFGRAIVAVGPITEQDVERMMKERQQQSQQKQQPAQEMKEENEEWRKWKSQEMEVAGRVELNLDLQSMFNIDMTKALALQVYVRVTDLASGQERFIQHVIPVFTRDVVYDIRPLEFEAGIKNEFEIIAKRPDGKPTKMEDMIVTLTMMIGNDKGKVQEEKSVEVKEFYTRGRNDIGFFAVDIPAECIGVLMTITPLGEDGKVRGYRTHAVPLMPTPRRETPAAKLTIELLPSVNAPAASDPKAPVVSSQISTVGRTSNFYVQILPSKPVEKFEPVRMSYVMMTNGRITHSGEFNIQPTKECQSKATRSIQPEQQGPPACVFNGTLSIPITRSMVPYSTLLVYTFQPSFGFNLAESYRFSVAGLFQGSLALNATVVPYTSTRNTPEDLDNDESFESSEEVDLQSVQISTKAQDKARVQLSFTGTPGATVGLNVIEYDGVMQGLSSEITKERLLQYLTAYEQVPIIGMPSLNRPEGERTVQKTRESQPETSTDYKEEYSTTTESNDQDKRAVKHTGKHPKQVGKGQMKKPMNEKPKAKFAARSTLSDEEETDQIHREESGFRLRYPLEKMVFGVLSSRNQKSVEGDDVYSSSNMERFYGDDRARQSSSSSHYRRKAMKSMNQYDVTVNDNDFVVATSVPLIFAADARASTAIQPTVSRTEESEHAEINDDEEDQPNENDRSKSVHGSPSWYEKLNSKLSTISQEAFTFMQSGLSVVSDFETLRLPSDMQRVNLTKLFSRYRQQSTFSDEQSFTDRDEARQVLEQYLVESDMSMVPPVVLFEEQARLGYYRSAYFGTGKIEAEGTGKVVLPRTKPYSTWLATGFALSSKSGLSIAQPIRVPSNQGLFVLANFPNQIQNGEHGLLTYGINNYLNKDLTNVVIRIRASADFDLIEQSQPERIVSSNGKDYTITLPTLKSYAVETRSIILVPKRAGVVKIIIEVESEFGGDYEVITTYVRESGIQRKQQYIRVFDMTEEKKTVSPVVHKVNVSPFLRSVRLAVSGTGLDRLIERYAIETNNLIGIDRAIIRLWRAIGLRRYLNETSQAQSMLDDAAEGNITTAYQQLQLYSEYNGSYSFISDEGLEQSSLYLTTLSFGALISPFMPVRDNVTINRTLSWILSRQQQDGSFDDQGPCYHYRFCSGEFRREGLTALFMYTLTRDNTTDFLPEFARRQLFNGEQSPVVRAQRYLESRLDAVKTCPVTLSLVELVLSQSKLTSQQLRQKIQQSLISRQLTVVPEDGSKFWKSSNELMTYDDQLLVNSLTLSLYASFGDYKTTTSIARWIVQQMEVSSCHDTVLDAVFNTEAWLQTDSLFRRQYGPQKFAITVDVSADNGQKQQFKIDQTNMDLTQKLRFTLPVKQITYTVTGFGIVGVQIKEMYVEQQQQTSEPTPFQLSNEFTPFPWLNEIKAKTCLTYTPTAREQKGVKENFNRTVVLEFQLPSGKSTTKDPRTSDHPLLFSLSLGSRVNLRQIGFLLSRLENVMYFTFHERENTLNFFLNIPSTVYGKAICLEWYFERLSFVSSWAPVQARAYDYLEQDTQFARLFPVQLQPNLLGYPLIDAIHKSRPSLDELTALHKQQQEQINREKQ